MSFLPGFRPVYMANKHGLTSGHDRVRSMLAIAGPPQLTENRDVALKTFPDRCRHGICPDRRFDRSTKHPCAAVKRADAAGTPSRETRRALAVAARRCLWRARDFAGADR